MKLWWSASEDHACVALTAVWAVMWVQPTILAPASGFSPCARFLSEIKADMSVGGTEREPER